MHMVFRPAVLAACVAMLVACDQSDQPANQTNPPTTAAVNSSPATSTAPASNTAAVSVAKPKISEEELAKQYMGQAMRVVDASEVEYQGASTILLSFSVPIKKDQSFSSLINLIDKKTGKVDGAWELSEDGFSLRMRHIEPNRELTVTTKNILGVNGNKASDEFSTTIKTRNLMSTVGFASSGSLLPTEIIGGLPVTTINVKDVNVEYFRVKPEDIPRFLSNLYSSNSISSWEFEDIKPHLEFVYTGYYKLDPEANTRETVMLPIANVEQLQKPGMYFAVMRAVGEMKYSQPMTYFSLTDIGLSVHQSANSLDVFSQALAGGAALQDVELNIYDIKGNILGVAKTDKKGHARISNIDFTKARLLAATKNEQTTVLQLTNPALDLTEFKVAGPKASDRQLFVFGPRDLYRPGETVLLNALLRDIDGKPLPAQPVAVKVMRPDGKEARKFTWTADKEGFYQYSLPISGEGPTGTWSLILDLGGGLKQNYDFLVEDFLPERLALELKGVEGSIGLKQSLVVDINGRYLYGAPAAENRVNGQVYARLAREAVPSLPGYHFGDVTQKLNLNFELDEIKLDSKGLGRYVLSSDWADVASPVNLIAQISLLESGGRPVTRRMVQPAWPSEFLPGIRSLGGSEVDGQGIAKFDIVYSNVDGKRLDADGLKVRLVRERRDYYWSYSNESGWRSHYNQKNLVIANQEVKVEKDKTTTVSFPLDWGPYRVEVEDPKTQLVSSTRVWAGYSWQENTDGGNVRPDQVKLALDKPAYVAGDKAAITVTPPAAGKGYLLVESSEGPLWWQEIEVGAEGKVFEIPVDKAWARHDLYISALIVRPGERKASVTPKRAVGLLHLPLDREQRKLDIALNAPERIRPNSKLPIEVQVLGKDGKPVKQARVLVAAVDVGILNITQYKTPDPYAAFFGRKAYGIDQRDIYSALIEGNGKTATLAYGGDAALADGGARPKTSVTIVAKQSQVLTLDEQGKALVNLDIPDFNGQVRLMAQAWTTEDFGSQEAATTIAAPIVAEMSAPRFMAGGDESVFAFDVTNLTDQVQNLTVSVETQGLLAVKGEGTQNYSLNKGERKTLKLPITASNGYGQGTVKLTVAGLNLPGEKETSFSREWKIGVRPPYPALLQSYKAVIEAQKSWTLPVGALDRYQPEGLEALLTVSSLPPLNISSHIRALRAYPYGCVEQTTSGLYPSLYVDKAAMSKLGIKAEDEVDRRANIELGIDRLLGMQLSSGGFSMWGPNGSEEYWATVYVTDFLIRAREQGYSVPNSALDKATKRLVRYVQEAHLIDERYSDRVAASRFAVQAYAGYVLARKKQAPLGQLRALYDRRETAGTSLSLVQLSVALELMGDKARAQTAMQEAFNMPLRPEYFWIGDYGSPLRDQALILAMLQEHNLEKNLRGTLLMDLSNTLAGRGYLSTQERNALFLAGRYYLDYKSAPWHAKLLTGDKSLEVSDQNSVKRLNFADLENFKALDGDAEQTLYQRIEVSGYPNKAPEKYSNVLDVERQYLTPDGRLADLDNLKSGDLVLVHVAIRAKDYRVSDALLVDMLPAGLELENQNLANSSASLSNISSQVKTWRQSMSQAQIKHQEYRDDRYVAALVVDRYSPVHILYLARAVTPGTYHVPPPQVESMYRPEWQAIGETPSTLTVRPK